MSDLEQINQLEERVAALVRERTEFIDIKKTAEVRLTTNKNLVRTSGKMPHLQYKQACDSQTHAVRDIRAAEVQLARLKGEIIAANHELDALKRQRKERISGKPAARTSVEPTIDWKRDCVEELVSIRQHYQEFAADGSRISSMRQMAAEFANKLNPIIKRFLKD